MKNISPNFLQASRSAFLGTSSLTMEDIRDRVARDSELSPTQRRDRLSCLSRLEKWTGQDLPSIRASAPELRRLLADLSAIQLKTSEKTLKNVKSLVSRVLCDYGDPNTTTTSAVLSKAWADLRATIPWEYARAGLARLMCFCSVMDIQPDQVDRAVLLGLFEALEAECVVKSPKAIIKTTITSWNRCHRDIPNWPGDTLCSPFKKERLVMPLELFPQPFQEDVNELIRELREPDMLDDSGPSRALRPATLAAKLFDIRRFATGLVRSNTVKIEDIKSISILVTLKNFKASLRFFLDRNDNEITQNLHNLANSMRHIANHHVGLSQQDLDELHKVCKRIDPKNRGRLTKKNRERLRQFDDPRNKVLFLKFPATQFQKAKSDKNAFRAAKRIERALQVGLLMHCGVRSGTLRALEHEADFSWQGPGLTGTCKLFAPGCKVKTHRDMESELPAYLAEILADFIQNRRLLLPGASGPYLFPGGNGGMRSDTAVYDSITDAFWKELGLVIHPHLIRHAIGKIVLEHDPSAGLALARTLGHATFDTTYASYLGTEGKTMGEHVDRILEDVKTSPTRKPSK